MACALMMLWGAPTPAADAPTTDTLPVRFGFVDIELVLAESDAIRKIVAEIDEDLAKRDEAIRAKRRELSKLKLSLETQRAVLSQQERDRRQQAAVAMLTEIDEMEYRFDREVKRKQALVIEPMLEEVVKIVGEVGQRDGYDLIVRGEMVLWGAKSVDLTPVVVRELDLQIDRLRSKLQRLKPDEGEVSPTPTPASVPLIP